MLGITNLPASGKTGMETLKGEITFDLGDITDDGFKKKYLQVFVDQCFTLIMYEDNSILGGGWQSQPGTRLSYWCRQLAKCTYQIKSP